MPKASSHKWQHWVPQSYAGAWCDPECPSEHEPYLNVIVKDGSVVQRKAPRNIFAATDLYTMPGERGERDLRVEKMFAKVESNFVQVRRDILDKRLPISHKDQATLLFFTACMHARSKMMMDHHGAFWADLAERGREMEKEIEELGYVPPAFVDPLAGTQEAGDTISQDEVEKIAAGIAGHVIVPLIKTTSSFLVRMRPIVFCTDLDPGFITSDTPGLLFDPDAMSRPPLFRTPGFGYPNVELMLPLSPSQMLVVVHGVNTLEYVDAPPEIVQELNRRLRFSCQSDFVVRRAYLEPRWFDENPMPPHMR